MVTKRIPGAVLGQPKKTIMTVKERRAREGRPTLLFIEDPDRYECAIILATQGRHVSKTRAALFVAGIERGRETSPYSITSRSHRAAALKIAGASPQGKETLMLSKIELVSGRAEWLKKKILAAQKDRKASRWLIPMSAAFDALFCGDLPVALRLAAMAGETQFAEKHFAAGFPAKPTRVAWLIR